MMHGRDAQLAEVWDSRPPLKWRHKLVLILGAIAFGPLLITVAIIGLACYVSYAICLRLVIWAWWCSRGRHTLFVYSNSSIWREYIEDHLLPQLHGRAHVLNWSERKHWRFSLATLAFHHFGGSREFNPLAVVFRPFRRTRVFRFWRPFKEWKHGKTENLSQLEHEFLALIGAGVQTAR